MDIITAYTKELKSMIEIASHLGISRVAVWKRLKKQGVDTSKARRIQVECHWCEKSFLKRPSEARRHNHHYCSFDCYLDYIKELGHAYIENRSGQRRARSLVSAHFDLLPGYIVHHEDKDTLNNMFRNLKVFRNHSEHMRYHRGEEASPLWDGRSFLVPGIGTHTT